MEDLLKGIDALTALSKDCERMTQNGQNGETSAAINAIESLCLLPPPETMDELQSFYDNVKGIVHDYTHNLANLGKGLSQNTYNVQGVTHHAHRIVSTLLQPAPSIQTDHLSDEELADMRRELEDIQNFSAIGIDSNSEDLGELKQGFSEFRCGNTPDCTQRFIGPDEAYEDKGVVCPSCGYILKKGGDE